MVKQKRLFVACIMALVATAFGFGARLQLLGEMGETFGLSETQKGALGAAGLFPFALSIIFFSLILDRMGYGMGMLFAFVAHVVSAVMTLMATSFAMLYMATLLFAFANGAVEAVINPVTATLFPKNKTHYLNILHAGWPGGMALGMIIIILLGPTVSWQVKMAIFLVPTAVYGIMLLGQKWPVQERVAAGVSYLDMMKEFGWASCFIVSFFTVLAINTVPVSLGWYADSSLAFVIALAIATVASIIFQIKVRSFGQPLFVFLLLVMILLATTELGTDSWMGDIMQSVAGAKIGAWIPVLTAVIMFVLRFFAGPIVHRITPLGLLCVCAFIAAAGLMWIAYAAIPPSLGIVLIGATLYGVGKTFYWPTTLGVVCEQFPKGGAMTINSIAGVGMISVGVIGGSFLGTLQDVDKDRTLKTQDPAVYEKATEKEETTSFLMTFRKWNQPEIDKLPEEEKKVVDGVKNQVKQTVLAKFAILPAIMFLCYLGLIFYFKSKGGYKIVELPSSGDSSPPPQS
jgi:MFS family permease